MTLSLNTPLDDATHGRRNCGFFDDMFEFVSGDRWTSLEADAGASVAGIAGVNGQVRCTTGAVLDNEAYLYTTQEWLLIAENKPIVLETRMQFQQQASDQGVFLFGMMDAVGANAVVALTGPKATYSGATFYTIDADDTWRVQSADGATKTSHILDAEFSNDRIAKAAGGGLWQTLRIEITPVNSNWVNNSFFIDGTLVRKHTGITYANATEAQVVIGIKAGSGTSENIQVDYIAAYQLR